MADRPDRGRPRGDDDPDYDWLYGRRAGRGSGDDAAADDETRVQPSSGGSGWQGGSSPRDPEPTRMLPTMGRPSRSEGRSQSEGGSRSSSQGPYETPPPPARPRDSGRGSPPPSSGRSRSRTRGRWRRWVVAVVALWVLFLVAVPLIAWSRIEKVDATPSGDRPDDQPGTTYLLVGSDSREGLSRKQELQYGVGKAAGRRTDTIMLLHTGRGPNLLMSIPRDSLVNVPGHGLTKINAAYAFGGPDLLVSTVEGATGIRVDDYVEIGFAGFVNLVDAVNGIEICPKQAMRDKLANLKVKKGCQDVDGKVALGYARSRHTSGLGDIDRARHQREVVSAVGSKAASPWSVINPVRYWRLAMAGSDSLAVGEDTGMLATIRFAWAMTRVNGTNGLTCGVPIADLAVHWDRDRALRLFRFVKNDDTADIPKPLCRPSGLRAG